MTIEDASTPGDQTEGAAKHETKPQSLKDRLHDQYRRGFALVPTVKGERKAAIKWGGITERPSLEEVVEVFNSHPGSDIGILTEPSDLFVVDDDGGLAEFLEQTGLPLPDTYRVRTAKGCHHYFYAVYNDTNRELLRTQTGVLGLKVDFKGTRTLLPAAGNLHPSKACHYVAENPAKPTQDLPQEWWDWLAQHQPERGRVEAQRHRTFTRQAARTYIDTYATKPLHAADNGQRNAALNKAAIVYGHFVPEFLSEKRAVARLERAAEVIGLDALEIEPTILSGLTAGMAEPYGLLEEDEDLDDGDVDTWEPVNLWEYLTGTFERAKPTVGMTRRDGVGYLYPGKEHAAIGEMECGKTWFATAHCKAEMEKGNDVVYIHFEEGDPISTIERLKGLGVSNQMILDHFIFVGPERRVQPSDIDRILDGRNVTLVVLDGQNEAMALHGNDTMKPDGAAEYRRKLTKPFKRAGAAVLSLDHVVKDPNEKGKGYAAGSAHKGNGLDGALFLLENVEPFGKGRSGLSAVAVTKDRPGHLRQFGIPSEAATRKTKFGTLGVNATDEDNVWVNLNAPTTDEERAEAEEERAYEKHVKLDNAIFEKACGFLARGPMTGNDLARALGGTKQDALGAFIRLEKDGRLIRAAVAKNGRSYDGWDVADDPAQTAS